MSDRSTGAGRQAVVAIDGPSGSGKSTVARGVARRLRWRYLDTGAMYRAVTWLALHGGVDLSDGAALTDLAERADLVVTTDPDDTVVIAGGTEITSAIRGREVTAAVSAVSAVPGVRAALVRRQRELVGAGRIVVEGRDIGTAVVPDAVVKVYLTASSDARALRRAREHGRHEPAHVTSTRVDLERRDTRDSSRAASPLAKAADAHEIDSTPMSVDEVVDQVLSLLPAELVVS